MQYLIRFNFYLTFVFTYFRGSTPKTRTHIHLVRRHLTYFINIIFNKSFLDTLAQARIVNLESKITLKKRIKFLIRITKI